jgi:hypothetical protein
VSLFRQTHKCMCCRGSITCCGGWPTMLLLQEPMGLCNVSHLAQTHQESSECLLLCML